MSPEEILARVSTTYATTAEYADTGEVFINSVKEGAFRTRLERAAGRFLFEGEISSRRYLLDVRDSTVVRFEPPHDVGHDVGLAIAALTGVTWGAAHNIPRLLWPSVISGRSILDGPSCALRSADDRAEILLTSSRMPGRLIVDTRSWAIVSYEHDLSDLSTFTTTYKPVF